MKHPRKGFVKVIYEGVELYLSEVAKVEGLTHQQVHNWWRGHGRPVSIRHTDLQTVHQYAERVGGRYTIDGERMGSTEASNRFGIPYSTLNSMLKRAGKADFTTAEINAMREAWKERKESASKKIIPLEKLSNKMTMAKIKKLNSIPGPSSFERKYMADAGKNGVQNVPRANWAGTNGQGFPIYTGRM